MAFWHMIGRALGLHLYPTGGHGFSLFSDGSTEQGWGSLCIDWLNSLRNN